MNYLCSVTGQKAAPFFNQPATVVGRGKAYSSGQLQKTFDLKTEGPADNIFCCWNKVLHHVQTDADTAGRSMCRWKEGRKGSPGVSTILPAGRICNSVTQTAKLYLLLFTRSQMRKVKPTKRRQLSHSQTRPTLDQQDLNSHLTL